MALSDPNPKDLVGRTKVPLSLFPPIAVAYGAVGMYEGMLKYGKVNFRASFVYASIYIDAAMRHLNAWMEGQEHTAEGGPHLGNALACIAIVIDAKTNGTLVDDRPLVSAGNQFFEEMEALRGSIKALDQKFGSVKPKHWTRNNL